jgi:hypothetical protein
LLPDKACALLQKSTPIWINDTLTYGPVRKPVNGRGMCYHAREGGDWLARNGFSVQKAGSIEMYSAADFGRDHEVWGIGGSLVHEFSHAYHDKFCRDGYSNSSVKEAYSHAMVSGLYDRVAVHGSQGRNGPAKAYASVNHMEYWAELSVAYMWKENDTVEYNKWFPFNRAQLISHDPTAYCVLDELWTNPLINVLD